MSDNNYPYGNTFSQRDLSLPTNQKIPKSMRDSGTNLDECCGDITQSEVPAAMDAHKCSLPEAEATKIINQRSQR
jgi:hypothetical protein